jgi:hypothetical protein
VRRSQVVNWTIRRSIGKVCTQNQNGWRVYCSFEDLVGVITARAPFWAACNRLVRLSADRTAIDAATSVQSVLTDEPRVCATRLSQRQRPRITRILYLVRCGTSKHSNRIDLPTMMRRADRVGAVAHLRPPLGATKSAHPPRGERRHGHLSQKTCMPCVR